MATAESVFDGIGHLEEEIVVSLSGGPAAKESLPKDNLPELPEWPFYPSRYNDPFSLGLAEAVFFHAMRRLLVQLLSHA